MKKYSHNLYAFTIYGQMASVTQNFAAIGGGEVRGFDYDYAYDPIGNRTSATYYDEQGEAVASAYTANALNQYTQRTVPGNVQVRGEADPDAIVTVNENPTWRYPSLGGSAAQTSPRSGATSAAPAAQTSYFYGGDLASTFTHRFSTKPWCPITGLCEYQMRKYRPEIGRWLSRDRLGERGGVNLWQYVYNNALAWFDYLGRAPQYVYPGVIVIHDPNSGRNHIVPSPDWDWGDYDPEFGGKKRSPVKPRIPFPSIPFPSVTWGLAITILMVTHEFLFSDGCAFYCISWAPVDLVGIGIETSFFKQVSPLTVTYGLHKYLSVGTSATTVDVNVGLGRTLPSLVHPSVRLFCLALTGKAKNGCPCKDLKPTSVGGYLE